MVIDAMPQSEIPLQLQPKHLVCSQGVRREIGQFLDKVHDFDVNTFDRRHKEIFFE